MKQSTDDIYIRCQGDDNEYVCVATKKLPENPYDLIYLLKVETAPRSAWLHAASAYFRAKMWPAGVTVLEQATSDDVESMLRDDDTTVSRLDLLAALGGAHIMLADSYAHNSTARADNLRKAADVFSRADKIDLDDPSIWAARGWAEFHAGKSSAANWFDNARDKDVVLGAIGLAALHLNRPKPAETGKNDPVSLLVVALRSKHCPPGVWTGLAYALFRESRMKAARNIARRAVLALAKSAPEEKREALYILALIESTDRTASSLENMTLALREAYLHCDGHKDSRILALIAELHFNGGDFEHAEMFGKRAVEISDKLPTAVGTMFAGIRSSMRVTALFQLARAQHHLAKYDEAMRGFEKIKSIVESSDGTHIKANPGVYLRLGLLKLASGRKGDEAVAQECLEKVIKNATDKCGIARRALGVLIGRRVLLGLKRGRPRSGEHFHRAVSLLKKGIAEDNMGRKDVPAQLVYAGLLEESSPKQALESYQLAISALEDEGAKVDPEIWNNVSSLMTRLGKVDEARNISLTKLDSSFAADCAAVTYNRGRLAEMVEDYEEAKKIFTSVKKGSQHYFESITRLGVIAMKIDGNMEEAERLLKEALESSSTKSTAATFLSSMYTKQKKFKDAQEILEQNRHECDYLTLAFSSFMHRFLDSLDQERRSRFLLNHIGAPLSNVLKRSKHNAAAANGVGVYFAESKMIEEARDAFTQAGAGPLTGKVARVNLAHTQIQQGRAALRKASTATGRPSKQVISNSRALFEQAEKLYRDALQVSRLHRSKEDFHGHCELMLYMAWALFEGREFEQSADVLKKLVHLLPTSAVAWFNLGQALLESAIVRTFGKTRLEEMELAKDEYEGARVALLKCLHLDRNQVDPISKTQIDRKHAQYLDKYCRQQAKTHDVNLRNAVIAYEDLEMNRKKNLEKLQAHREKEIAKKKEEERKRVEKERELKEAFEQSELKKRQYLEEEARANALREEELDDGDGTGDGRPTPQSKSRGKRKKTDSENGKVKKSAKRIRKQSVKRVGDDDDSGSEYESLNGNEEDGDVKKLRNDALSDGSAGEDAATTTPSGRKRFAMDAAGAMSDDDGEF